MFSQFIYLIVVLIIYSAYQPVEAPQGSLFRALFVLAVQIAFFAFLCRSTFKRLEPEAEERPSLADHRFHKAVNRLMILAIGLFAIDVWALDLPSFTSAFALFSKIPTLEGVFYLGLFVAHQAVLYTYAYRIRESLSRMGLARAEYVRSSLMLGLPVLIPWVVLSGIADIVILLPFKWPAEFLATTEGSLGFFLLLVMVVPIIAPVLIRRFWQCAPLPAGEYRSRIQGLLDRTGVQCADILYWPVFGGRMITAGVMGLVHRFRYILVTDALLTSLTPEEVDEVIAHEIGHVKRRHLVFYLVFLACIFLFSFAVMDLIQLSVLSSPTVYRFSEAAGFRHSNVVSFLTCVILIVLFLIYFRFVFGYFMRNFERQADGYVYSLFPSATPLINTFRKIAFLTGQSPDRPNWHHFSISERIAFLQKCEADKQWVNRHDHKVKKSIAVFAACAVLMAGVGYGLMFGSAGRWLREGFQDNIIRMTMELHPDDPLVYSAAGDIYQSRKQYGESISAYERSLELNPDNPVTLNNLAWVYATCEERQFRNPEKALTLSQRAARMSPAPFILDTLAESWFANGNPSAALQAAREALSAASENRGYYADQVSRFEAAARKLE